MSYGHINPQYFLFSFLMDNNLMSYRHFLKKKLTNIAEKKTLSQLFKLNIVDCSPLLHPLWEILPTVNFWKVKIWRVTKKFSLKKADNFTSHGPLKTPKISNFLFFPLKYQMCQLIIQIYETFYFDFDALQMSLYTLFAQKLYGLL